MKISLNDIKAIGDNLAKREPTPDSVREMPLKEVVMALAPELSRMMSRGFTTGDLLAVLKEHKISVTGRTTLNAYLKEYREGRKESRKRGKNAALVAASSAPSSAAVQQTAGNLFTPSEERKAAPATSGVPSDEPWREQYKDLI